VQQEALDALVHKLRTGAASGSDAIAILRGLVPEGLMSISEWQRLIGRALQTGRPVSVEATVSPRQNKAGETAARRTTARGKKKRTARKSTS